MFVYFRGKFKQKFTKMYLSVQVSDNLGRIIATWTVIEFHEE